MIPAGLLPHDITIITGVEIDDAYGDPTLTFDADDLPEDSEDEIGAVETKGWLQQDTASEDDNTLGNRLTGVWLLVTNTEFTARDRVAWGDRVFFVDGPVAPVHTPAGLHHYEANLRLVEG